MPSVKTMPKKAKNKKSTTSQMSHKKDSKPQTLSAEYIHDSESEDDGQSDSSSTSDDDSLPENPATSILKKSSQSKKPVTDSSSSSGSESESDSESEDESSSEESENEQVPSKMDKKKETVNSNGVKQAPKVSNTTAIAVEKPLIYSPPSGFEPASVNEGQRVSQLLKGSNLEGKEIWYITAPASVPLSSIEGLSLLAVKEHKEVLSYNGDAYAFTPGATEVKGSTKVMIPNTSEGGYRTGKIPISRSLHLQQSIPGAKFTSKVTTPAKMPVREQPRGLKMRYCPIGFETEQASSSSSDQEMLDAPAAEFRKAGSISSFSNNSEDEDLSSDVNASAAAPPSKSETKSKTLTDASTKASERSKKRKHSDEEKKKKKSKHSSSRLASMTDDRKLKRIKIQVENQKTTDSQLPSIEPRSITPTILPPKLQSTGRILPPLSGVTKPKTVLVHPRASFTPSAEPPPVYSQNLAMDPDLTAKEPRKKLKKLKKTRDGSAPETKQTKEKAAVSPQPSSRQLTSCEDQVHLREEKDGKKREKRRKDQITSSVQGISGAVKANALPRSTTTILPPKYAVKR